ncbi:MAG: phosphoethanolamine transferase [Gammaproteobacteria bacterium]
MNIITKGLSSSKLIIFVSVFLYVLGNFTFVSEVLKIFPVSLKNILFLLSLSVVFICFNIILLSLVSTKYTIKPALILIVLISSLSAYFMDTYKIVIDVAMIDNILNSDVRESLELFSITQLLYFLFLGVLPSILIYKINIQHCSLKKSIISRVSLLGASIVTIIIMFLLFGNYYASFIREHKPLRYYSNPSYYIYSTGRYISNFFDNSNMPFKHIGQDAKKDDSDGDRELIIFVVGETARADHFSLNGYSRKTNPYLEKENVISFQNIFSCGTSTAYSVPCLFSIYDQSNFEENKAKRTENVLDILYHSGSNVIWLDNNSNSKGVADRIPHESYKTDDKNSICDVECRDIGMLTNLQAYIDAHQKEDIFIVLHQMGNHGPAYYKRYPPAFEKFKPVCKTNELELCSNEAIRNAYDNALLYTDYFLSQVIALLKNNEQTFEAALFYISDHGESLGENGLYLHGLPYMLAPESQTHVPLIMWFSNSYDKDEVNIDTLRLKVRNNYSHDNIFHTILGLMEVETDVYDESMDIIKHAHSHSTKDRHD